LGIPATTEDFEPSFLAPGSNCYESECSAILDMINDPLVSTDADYWTDQANVAANSSLFDPQP